jgi:PKD repeat protein
LTYTAGLSNQLAQYYQTKSDNTIFNSTTDWNLLINNPSANFSESISGNTTTFTNSSSSVNSTLNYSWNFGDGNTSSVQNPSHTYTTNGTYTVTLIASNCIFSDTITKTIQIGTNSMEENTNTSFEFYPNPTTHQITINVEKQLLGSVYTIYDYTGKSTLSGKILLEQSVIDLEYLSNGIYFINIGEHLKQTVKIVKE